MKIAAVGDNCMDVYATLGKIYPGGNPVNVAVYFVRLGGQASYIGVVGNDTYGKIMKEKISEKKVDVSHLRIMEGSTAVTQVELIDGERVFGHYEEGVLADFELTEAEKDYICKHDLVVTGLWGNIHNDLKELKARGMKIAFDAATRPEDEAAKIAMKSVDYFFFASDDTDMKKIHEKMKDYQQQGPKLVISTLGERGSVVYDGKSYTAFGIVPCNVIDTMGAGDSYIAGFLKGILEGLPIKECMKKGAENSSITLEYAGAW